MPERLVQPDCIDQDTRFEGFVVSNAEADLLQPALRSAIILQGKQSEGEAHLGRMFITVHGRLACQTSSALARRPVEYKLTTLELSFEASRFFHFSIDTKVRDWRMSDDR